MTDKTGLGIADLLAEKRDAILALAARYKAYNVRVFGSVARGEAHDQSDIDLLVDFQPGFTIWDHIALVQDLSDLLGRKVDVLDAAGLSESFRETILKNVKPVNRNDWHLKDLQKRVEMLDHFTVDGKEAFFQNIMVQEAVIRCYEVMGEIVKRLSRELLDQYPQVDWEALAKFRDFLIHQYRHIRLDIVWDAVELHLKPLKETILVMLETLETTDEQSDNSEHDQPTPTA